MGLFRRTPKGKHALGAAVTSIPSGPLRVAAPPAMAVQPPAPPPAVRAAPVEPSVMASISELLASGEAWASELADVPALPTPAAEPAPVAQVPTVPAPLPPVGVAAPAYESPPAPLVEAVPVAPAPLPPVVPAPPVVSLPPAVPLPAAEELSARASLQAALADLLPQQEPVPVPSVARVQLGFRDGTSASLDPDSEQALALELLAQSLTRRD
ncbi:MAG: hypothetical protein EPN99_05755 [Frankiales bacterium]|nr:MAG: hypothetical protein EPN99_05755 [Frankiales bacterium]